MNFIIKIYKKYEEPINYLIIGVLTTVIAIISYGLFAKILHINYQISNVLSWIIAVAFAYITNKTFVFKSKIKEKNKVIREIIEFVKYRLLSLIIDMAIMYLLVELIKIDDMISKIIVQVVVIIINYIFSKLFVFKK